jgi:hypothetical protein
MTNQQQQPSMGVLSIRNYQLKNGSKVQLIVGVPEPFPDGKDYQCAYQITGLGDGQIRYAGGVDLLQSLQLALKMAASILITSPEYIAGQLYWLEDGSRDIGLPLPKGVGG